MVAVALVDAAVDEILPNVPSVIAGSNLLDLSTGRENVWSSSSSVSSGFGDDETATPDWTCC